MSAPLDDAAARPSGSGYSPRLSADGRQEETRSARPLPLKGARALSAVALLCVILGLLAVVAAIWFLVSSKAK
jgi:hypothetical protein